jgi:hypothetical protein
MAKRGISDRYDQDINFEKQFQYTDKLLGDYAKFAKEKPRISANEIKEGLRKFSGRQYEDQDKASYLNHILRPLTNTLRYGSYSAKEAKSLVSLKDAFQAYQDLAKINEAHHNWEEAAGAWALAGYIAKKAKANETAKRFFKKAGEAMDNMPLTGNKNYDRNINLRRGGAYGKMAELSEKESQDWEEGGDYSNASNAGTSAREGYERAGDFKNLARFAKATGWNKPYRTGLKKSGNYSELVKSFEEAAEDAEAKGYSQWAERYRKNAEKTRQLMKKRGISENSALEKITAAASILSFFSGLFLVSTNMTGNVIGSQSTQASWVIGTLLIITSIVGGFLFIKSRPKKDISKKKKL